MWAYSPCDPEMGKKTEINNEIMIEPKCIWISLHQQKEVEANHSLHDPEKRKTQNKQENNERTKVQFGNLTSTEGS